MPRTKVADFSVDFLQILDENGNCDNALKPNLSPEQLQDMYKKMVLARAVDKKLLNLQRSGKLGTLASSEGQEACQIPAMAHLQKDDWLVITFRENPACLARGVPITTIFQYWGGDERGCVFDGQYESGVTNIFPVSIPIASQLLHAVGTGMASNLLNKNQIAIAYCGDGGTSQGDFYEALNFASDFKTPTIFIVQNNQYAISLPVARQSHATTLAQKGVAFNMPSIKVDGNDVFAVYAAVGEAAERARKGDGPTLIECFTYRMGHHTTSDDSHKYRDDKEVEEWRQKDPIKRLREYMQANNMWDEGKDKETWTNVEQQVEQAVKDFEAMPGVDPTEMLHHTFKEMPWHLQEQEEMLKEYLKKHN